MRIKVGDTVKVMAGDDKGTTAKVLRVIRDRNKLVVEGVNKVFKHMRKSQKNPQGGRLSKEMPIDASNVMLLCPQTNTPRRIGVRIAADGSKERFVRKTNAAVGTISPPRNAAAGKKAGSAKKTAKK